MLRVTSAVLTQTFFKLRISTFLVGKIRLLFHQKTALCCMLIFFYIEMKKPCLDQTQKRYVSENPFQIFFEAGNQLSAGACSADQHQVIMPS